MIATSDQQILDLCTKVIATQDSPEFQAAMEELRATLHQRISSTRDKGIELAHVVINTSDSQPAD
jgi:hypothetical protein